MNNANDTTHRLQALPHVSPTAGNSGRAGCQTDDPSRAFLSSPASAKTQVVFVAEPTFYNLQQVATKLCCSAAWILQQAKTSDLFKPSVPRNVQHKRNDTPTPGDRTGGRGGGGPCRYHREHLDIIANHLMAPDVYDAAAALADWNNRKVALRLACRPDRKARAAK